MRENLQKYLFRTQDEIGEAKYYLIPKFWDFGAQSEVLIYQMYYNGYVESLRNRSQYFLG